MQKERNFASSRSKMRKFDEIEKRSFLSFKELFELSSIWKFLKFKIEAKNSTLKQKIQNRSEKFEIETKNSKLRQNFNFFLFSSSQVSISIFINMRNEIGEICSLRRPFARQLWAKNWVEKIKFRARKSLSSEPAHHLESP